MSLNKHLGILALGTAVLLLIPFTAMQFTDEVQWTVSDFGVAGTLLFGTGLLCSLAIQKIAPLGYRIVTCLGLLAALLLVWAELAVGVLERLFGG